jgi:hypothetical protein
MPKFLCRDMISQLRTIPVEQWDWTPAPSAPSPHIVAEHTWHWLVADRLHLQEPDVTQHAPIPAAPIEPHALCEALETEQNYWRETLPTLTPEQFAAMTYEQQTRMSGRFRRQSVFPFGEPESLDRMAPQFRSEKGAGGESAFHTFPKRPPVFPVCRRREARFPPLRRL